MEGLRRGMFFLPDPYVKFRIVPDIVTPIFAHHGQQCRSTVCENTVNPIWKRQVS